jgi:hypothetical protein
MVAFVVRPIGRLVESAMGSKSRFLLVLDGYCQTFTAAARCSTGIMSSGSGRWV